MYIAKATYVVNVMCGVNVMYVVTVMHVVNVMYIMTVMYIAKETYVVNVMCVVNVMYIMTVMYIVCAYMWLHAHICMYVVHFKCIFVSLPILYLCMYVHPGVYTCVICCPMANSPAPARTHIDTYINDIVYVYGVALVSRIDKITGLV